MNRTLHMADIGGSDVLKLIDSPVPKPGPGELRLRHEAVGVNFIDIYQRTGRYPPPPQGILGVEGAGVVEALGEGVSGFAIGQRVAYAGPPVGAYAELRCLPASRLIALPDDLSCRRAAASFLRGLTAHMLLFALRPVGPGTSVLVHGGAGGLGQMLLRWGHNLGARMIATVGSPAKVALAEAAGADVVVLRRGDWVGAVREASGGAGVDLACDGIGGDTLLATLESLVPFGIATSIGEAGGRVPPVDPDRLRQGMLSRPSVMAYAADPIRYAAAAADLTAFLRAEPFDPVGAIYPLAEAARAHDDLASGRTTGSLLLIP